MKFYLSLLLLLVSIPLLVAQEKSTIKTFIGATASRKDNITVPISKVVNGRDSTYYIKSVALLSGMPYVGLTKGANSALPSTQNYVKDLGFPWGVRYRYNTFSEDAFSVSKGYFSDRIEINWDIKKNQERIINITVYRTEDVTNESPDWGRPLKTLAGDVGTFSDINVEGGKLYRYKILAKGVEAEGLEIIYSNFITGIGYRNPTGVITGNIAYAGGNPVKDVLVSATPTGSNTLYGSSLKVPSNSYISIPNLYRGLQDSVTLQAWIKPTASFAGDELKLFELYMDNGDVYPTKLRIVNDVLYVDAFHTNLSISHYIPSGEIDNKGDDRLIPISSLLSSFTHISFVIRDNKIPEVYINGRLINAAYVAKMNAILDLNSATASVNVAYSNNNYADKFTYVLGRPTWTSVKIGGGKEAYFDELRIWETALTPAQIQRDFRRYLKGNEARFNTYIRANERSGDYAYDLAQTGLIFHGNNAKLSHSPVAPSWANSEDQITNIPSSTQLGVLGVTDEFGNYVISSVPYSGLGDTYTIVPTLGRHEFNPKQELSFLGSGSTVVNNVDFIDQSSFTFKGQVVYDSRGVFSSTLDAAIIGDIKDDEAYNAYVKGNLTYQKGEYWAVKNSGGTIQELHRYAKIPVPGAYVNIDNTPAIDANNVPIQTDINGQFTIEVPIGKHAISVVKSGHTFDLEGRYPARTRSVVNQDTTYINTYQDFFEDRDEPITFIDTTKVTVVGRVVGGLKQAGMPLGFGDKGRKIHEYTDENQVSQSEVYTSFNNIGRASIKLGHLPAGATSVTRDYQTTFLTNSETGEFRVKLLPLSYQLSKDDLTFLSGKSPNNALLLSQDRTLNYTTIKPLQYPTYTAKDTSITGEPYHEVLKFTHIATPIHNVISQTADSEIKVGSTTYTLQPLVPYSASIVPIYTQFADYSIRIQGLENYYNYDQSVANPQVSSVPVEGGSIVATNNLALANSERFEVLASDPSITIYRFKGGNPNTNSSTLYKRTLQLNYSLNGVEKPIDNAYYQQGIVLGGVADGSQTFVTAGPELPDFVLRDPPGSNSSATIEKGSTFSFTKENSSSSNNANELNATISLGFKLSVGGGLLGPVMETQVTNDVSSGVSMAQTSTDGNSVTNTYSFNQSISTSDDPDWVGSDADLYIGSSANQFYGTYDQLTLATTYNAALAIPVKNGSVSAVLYPNVNKAMYFNEAPEKTMFVYSQRTILTDLIPKYESIITQIDNGTLTENAGGVLSRNAYNSSINLWRKIILNNELAKYQAFKSKDSLRLSLDAIIETLKDPVTSKLSATGKKLKDLLNSTFYENISLDAGVGGITKGTQIEQLTSNTLSYQVQLDESVALAFGAAFNETGFEMNTVNSSGSGNSSSSEDVNNESTTINYTLRDIDRGNLLSVDVINAFDGNGPLFITKGGETSCPFEGAELSHFYKPNHPNVTNLATNIVPLSASESVALSVATMPLERPDITVLNRSVSGMYEGRNAEFVLQLSNASTVKKDAVFKLMVDQSSNPDNALINIEPNGTLINIPGGRTVTYTLTLKKVKQDQFSYDNIRVLLESTCDEQAVDTVLLSANFVPACTPVRILSPDMNWLLNKNNSVENLVSNQTKPVYIKIGDYNRDFSNFKQINVDYRLKGTSNWQGLRTYYKNQSEANAAMAGGEDDVEWLNGPEMTFGWDIVSSGLANGTYEIRAHSSCTNRTTFESEIIEGKVDLSSPVLFSTPTPKNGILNIGDDITLRFNEPVKKNGTVTNFEFLVQTNQLPVAHEVSLAFNGESNVATIKKPALTTGDFSIEFWLNNRSPMGTSTLLSQEGGIKIELINSDLQYTIGGQSLRTPIAKDSTFNFYALSYEAATKKLSIIENSTLKTWNVFVNPLNFTNPNPISLGGNSFKGNLHDLRFWKKAISREQAAINMNSAFSGNEPGLIGYWPLNEGNGTLANDLARYKHLTLENVNWDIFPKGTAYNFDGSSYLKLDSVSKVVITKEMDATLSLWMKTNQTTLGTLLSNGFEDTSDAIESNGYRNKWSLVLNSTGGLDFKAESKTYSFGSIPVNNDTWHHIALSLTRNGTLRMYIDGKETATYPSNELGGFNGSTIQLGAQAIKMTDGSTDYTRFFSGQLDELSFWKSARTAEQIKADRYHEVNVSSTGLLLYATFNKPATYLDKGPKYFYPFNAFSQTSTYAKLNSAQSYTDVAPGIKQYRLTESVFVDAVINTDEIILKPSITDWASVEGKVATITVSNVNDLADNSQASPITWTAYIAKNPIKWFIEGQSEVVNLMKRTNEPLTFDITVINQGGVDQTYSLDVPSWLTVLPRSGTLAPNTSQTFKATVDPNLAVGDYNTVLELISNSGYYNKIQLDVRVLAKEPVLKLDPSKYTQSMNVIGRIKLDSVFTDDIYDKIVAIVNGEVRGMANVQFDPSFNEYVVYLTVYSNVVIPESVVFYIWDASDGKLKEATINNQNVLAFTQDGIVGTYSTPVIFRNTAVTGQQIAFNQGWTWTSFNVNDLRFSNLNKLTQTLKLATSDLIQSNSPALFDAYELNTLDSTASGWTGGISASGGIKLDKMYKVKLANSQNLNIKGIPVDLATWNFNLTPNWNWLPYVVSKNVPVGEALANFTPVEGDLIKSQSEFAIYTNPIGWKGTLTYMKAGVGYMFKSAEAKSVSYPSYLNVVNAKNSKGVAFQDNQSIRKTLGGLSLPQVDFTRFENSMSLIAKLPPGFQTVSFLTKNGELRGNGLVQNINGEDVAFISIYGDTTELLTAFIGTGIEQQATSKEIQFVPNAILGSLSRPILIELAASRFSLSPNPFTAQLKLTYLGNKSERAKITIYDSMGLTVYDRIVELNEGFNQMEIQPVVPSGVYIVEFKVGTEIQYQKVIKR